MKFKYIEQSQTMISQNETSPNNCETLNTENPMEFKVSRLMINDQNDILQYLELENYVNPPSNCFLLFINARTWYAYTPMQLYSWKRLAHEKETATYVPQNLLLIKQMNTFVVFHS